MVWDQENHLNSLEWKKHYKFFLTMKKYYELTLGISQTIK
jgi:hypothetical protein